MLDRTPSERSPKYFIKMVPLLKYINERAIAEIELFPLYEVRTWKKW